MSFDLSFHHKDDQGRIDPSVLSAFFRSLGHFAEGKFIGNTEFSYNNEDTGVYFSFNHFTSDDDSLEKPGDADDEEDWPNDAGLAFGINFMRPSFFGLEAFPLVERLAKHFDLLISDPQSEPRPKDSPWKELYESWCSSNDLASRADYGEGAGARARMSREKAQVAWLYNWTKSRLQNEIQEDVFFPRILFLRRKGANEVMTAVNWKPGLPQVIPRCDLIITTKVTKDILGRIKDTENIGAVAYSGIMDRIGSKMDSFDGPIEGMRILHASSGNSTIPAWIGLPLQRMDEFEMLAVEQFIDD